MINIQQQNTCAYYEIQIWVHQIMSSGVSAARPPKLIKEWLTKAAKDGKVSWSSWYLKSA